MMRIVISISAGMALFMQGCSGRSPAEAPRRSAAVPAPERKLPLADGGSVTIEQAKSLGSEGERVHIFDRNGQQVSMSWCGERSGSYDRMVLLFTQLQKAVEAKDRQAVARLIRYPLQVNGGGSERIESPASFIQRYGGIVTPNVTRTILQSDPRAVFCRSDSASASDGAVWASTRNGRTAIEVVNR